MKKILVLGHRGMLGNAVYRFFNSKENYSLVTTSLKWNSEDFKEQLQKNNVNIIINCIGAIPQKKPTPEDYKSVNIDLPIFLESLGKKIIHPSTDCEFLGDLNPSLKYSKNATRDAIDDYGKSKAVISKMIEDTFHNTKIIRTSIIGHELHSSNGLLDWFLNSEIKVNGYNNHYWNGITTLQWSKEAHYLIENWNTAPKLNQLGTEKNLSKYEVLLLVKEIYEKSIEIVPFKAEGTVNKCLESDKKIINLDEQLKELRDFYAK